MAKGDRIYIVDRKEMQEGLNRLQEKLESNDSKTDKRLTNLEQGLPADRWVNDTNVAYKKDVPADALPYAGVDMVGGMTRKTVNLIPFPYDFGESYTFHGVTFVANTDGSISLNGVSTNTQLENLYLNKNNKTTLPAGTYTISGIPLNGNPISFIGSLYDMDDVFVEYIFGNTFTITETRKFDILLQIAVGASFSGETVYPMLNTGDTALPYEPYFEGLRSAPVTEVESVGVNLIPFPYVGGSTTIHGVTFTQNNDGTIKVEGTAANAISYTVSEFYEKTLAKGTYFKTANQNSIWMYLTMYYNGSYAGETSWGNGALEVDWLSYNKLECVLYIGEGTTLSTTIYPMLHKGATALPYTPYRRETLPIPAEVQALDGYGWGVNADCYNYVDWEKKQFVKRVGCVDMGTIDWTFSGGDIFYTDTIDRKIGLSNLLCGKYPNANFEFGDMSDGTITGNSTIDITYVKDTSYTDAATFKSAMSGVMLYYELAEPVITDISDLLPDDNLIGVEGGGTVTMVNEYGYDVPSEITYQLKGAEE